MDSDTEKSDQGSHQNIRKFFTPDLRMLPSKLAYLFYYGSLGCCTMYFNVFFTSVGLTATQAGQITGLKAISSLIGAPLLGMLADYTGKRKILMLIISIINLCLIFPQPWVAEYVINFEYGTNTNTLFYTMMVLSLASGPLVLSLTSILDSFVMNLVKSSTKETYFGHQRIFGSIGSGAASFIAGFAVDHYKNQQLSDYTAAFYVFLPFCLIFIPLGFYAAMISGVESKVEPKNANDDQVKNNSKSLTMLVLETCSNLSNLIFLLTILLTGICNGLMLGFFYIYMEKELSSSKTIMGLSVAFGNLGEILMFPVSSKIIKKFGAIPCLISGVWAYFFRYMFLSLVTDPYFVLLIQLLNAFCFALFISAAIEEVVRISPKEICITMVSIVNALKFGFGVLIANVAGGATYDLYGGRVMYRGMAYICLVWVGVMLTYYYSGKVYQKFCGLVAKSSNRGYKEVNQQQFRR